MTHEITVRQTWDETLTPREITAQCVCGWSHICDMDAHPGADVSLGEAVVRHLQGR